MKRFLKHLMTRTAETFALARLLSAPLHFSVPFKLATVNSCHCNSQEVR